MCDVIHILSDAISERLSFKVLQLEGSRIRKIMSFMKETRAVTTGRKSPLPPAVSTCSERPMLEDECGILILGNYLKVV